MAPRSVPGIIHQNWFAEGPSLLLGFLRELLTCRRGVVDALRSVPLAALLSVTPCFASFDGLLSVKPSVA